MAKPTWVFADVTNTQLKFNWVALTGTSKGGVALTILNYNIEWDQGTGTYVSLDNTVSAADTSYTHLLRAANTTYRYKIRAVNKYGPATAFSSEV